MWMDIKVKGISEEIMVALEKAQQGLILEKMDSVLDSQEKNFLQMPASSKYDYCKR